MQLLRYRPAAKAAITADLVAFVSEKGEQLANRFIVVEPGKIRVSGP